MPDESKTVAASFREMAAMLGWKPSQEVWMLWGFFDEVGEHEEGGGEKCLTIGGCIATADQWTSFTAAWQPFSSMCPGGWFHSNVANDRQRTDGAIIIAQHVKHCFGLSVHIPFEHLPDPRGPKAGRKRIRMFYEHDAVDMIWHAGRHAKALDDQISLVFARHENFSLSKLEANFGEFQACDTRLLDVTVGDPRRLSQLQAADLVAYEVMRFQKQAEVSLSDRSSELRAPLRALINGLNDEH